MCSAARWPIWPGCSWIGCWREAACKLAFLEASWGKFRKWAPRAGSGKWLGFKAPPAPAASSGPLSGPWGGWAESGGSPSTLGPWLSRQLRERELERQKARTLQFWWKPLFGISEELEAAPQTLTGEPAGAKAAKALHEEKEVSGLYPPGLQR